MASRGYTADDVARTALRLLDDHGLPDLTMRRLAAALEVQPSALYWHFANKQTLLAELSDRIVARMTPGRPSLPADSASDGDGGAAGRDAASGDDGSNPAASGIRSVSREAAALRDALLAYRDGAEVVSSTLALGLGGSTARDRLSRAVRQDGVDAADADRAATTLLHFVLGHAWHEQQRMQYDSAGARLDDGRASTASADFAFGVDVIVAGLRARAPR
ncbi:TetR/AcrR family transcriptional regulator [Microbacterium enclense]|uniref:TetR/AcrR family transcriptional regulator n=1 Tax=Microbacterium enclense TaxID=993073 RepID=UPI0036DB048E